MEKETFSQKAISYAAILLLYAVAGGVLGYLGQTGALDLYHALREDDPVMRRQYYERAEEPMSLETYRRRTRLGWWIGCGAGAGLGIAFLVRKSD